MLHGHLLQSPTTLLPVQPSASPTYPHIHMPASSKISLQPQATVTVEHARTDTAIQLAIDFYYANRNTTTTVLYPRNNGRSPSRIKKTGISIRRVAAMHTIPFSQLQRAIAAGGELQTRSEAHEAEMRFTIAEEAALEEWCLAMYRWGSPVRLDILRCMAAAILEDRERRNIESAPDFFKRIMDPDLRDCTSLDVEGKIKAPDTSRIGHNWYKRFLTRHPAPKPVSSRALDHERAMNNPETITQYFNVLKSTMKEFNIKPQNIYNMDEKGFLIGVIKKSMCVLIEASEKAAFLRQPGDRENITVIETVGIFNQDMPPMVILKGEKHLCCSRRA